MAFSGAGAGTIGDPFQITTASEFMEMSNYGSSVYFKLMNDIDMTGVSNPSIANFSSVLDGNDKTVSNILYSDNSHKYIFTILDNANISNAKFIVTSNLESSTRIRGLLNQSSQRANIVVSNIHFILYLPVNSSVLYAITLSASATWTINNLIIEAPITRVFQTNVLCDIIGLKFNIYRSINAGISNVCVCDTFSGSIAKEIQIHSPSIITNGDVFIFKSISNGSRTLKESFINVNANCRVFSFVESVGTSNILENNYVTGSIETKNAVLRTNSKEPRIADYGLSLFSGKRAYTTDKPTIRNCFAFLNNISIDIFNVIENGINLFGYNDWYIPSINELSLIYTIRSNALFHLNIQLWSDLDYPFLPVSSSEYDSNNAKYIYFDGSTQSNDKDTLMSVILCRNLINIPGESSVGDEYESCVIIYKDGTNGIGACKTPLFDGHRLFKYGNKGTSVGTSDNVGSGLSNTNLIKALANGNESIVKYDQYDCESNSPVKIGVFDLNYQTVQNCYLHIAQLPSLANLASVENQQEVITFEDLFDEDTFSGFDFDDVWISPTTSVPPKLVNNPNFSFDVFSINVTNVNRISVSGESDSFSVVLGIFSLPPSLEYGIDVFEGETLIYSDDGDNHTIELSEERDYNLLIKTYAIVDTVKTYQTEYPYYHYYLDQIEVDTVVVLNSGLITNLEKDNPDYPEDSDYVKLAAPLVHGSCIYNGYIYGSPRNQYDGLGNHYSMSSIARIAVDDYSDFDLLEIEAHKGDGYDETVIWNFEQIVRIDKYLFTIGTVQSFNLPESPIPAGTYLVMIDTDTFDFKVFRLSTTFFSTIPLISDGQYLFIGLGNGTQKVDPSIFINAENKYNVASEFSIPNFQQSGWYYDNDLQGGHVDFPQTGYTQSTKGFIHSGQADGEYLYLSHTSTQNSGYYPDFMVEGKGICELQVVRKSDMTPAGWCFIPRSTDDMCQTIDWLFFGIEVLPGDNPDTYGYGWGAYSVKKSDVIGIDHSSGYVDVVKGLPPLHDTDYVPGTTLNMQSYASLIFGNYLLDFKTNKVLYILDISDVENWSLDEPIGNRTLKAIKFNIGGTLNYEGIANEALIDETGVFHSFLWKTPSGIFKYEISGLSFFLPPTMQTLPAVVNGESATLSGYILNDNGKEVTESGIELSDSSDPGTFIQFEYTGKSPSYDILFENLESKTYYFRAYAINEEGTGYGEIKQFTISGGTFGYIAGASIVKGIIGGVEITSVL